MRPHFQKLYKLNIFSPLDSTAVIKRLPDFRESDLAIIKNAYSHIVAGYELHVLQSKAEREEFPLVFEDDMRQYTAAKEVYDAVVALIEEKKKK